jgi:hypothetical protein
MDTISKILKAIMARYGSFCDLYDAMNECADTVYCNLEEDCGVDAGLIEDYIQGTL